MDVIDAIKMQAIGPVVLVGHSMGGRVAMHVADLAKDSGLLAALVIEDMDVTVRPGPHPAVRSAEMGHVAYLERALIARPFHTS